MNDFWDMVDKKGPDDCWLWKGPLANGYGRWGRDNAHRVAYSLFYQIELPHLGHDLCICHTCNNRACCNPRHLYKGSQKTNMRDAKADRIASHPEKYSRALGLYREGSNLSTEELQKRLLEAAMRDPRFQSAQHLVRFWRKKRL